MVKLLQITTCCLLIFTACKPQPEPINYGHDGCRFCMMTIMDPRYAAEVVTDKGKVHKFDAVECMVNYLQENPQSSFSHILVSTFDNQTLEDAANCYYLRSGGLPSPMGMYITSISTKETAGNYKQEYDGRIYSWKELNSDFNKLPILQPTAKSE